MSIDFLSIEKRQRAEHKTPLPTSRNVKSLHWICLGTWLWLRYQKIWIFFWLKFNMICMFWIVLMCWCQKWFLKNEKISLTYILTRKVIWKATTTTLPNTLFFFFRRKKYWTQNESFEILKTETTQPLFFKGKRKTWMRRRAKY